MDSDSVHACVWSHVHTCVFSGCQKKKSGTTDITPSAEREERETTGGGREGEGTKPGQKKRRGEEPGEERGEKKRAWRGRWATRRGRKVMR